MKKENKDLNPSVVENIKCESFVPKLGDFLIVIDMQNDFIDGSLGSEDAQAIVPKVENLIKLFHEKTARANSPDRIVYTLDTHRQNYLDTLEGKKLPVRHCIQNTAGQCLPDNLVALMDEYRATPLIKTTFGTLDFPCLDDSLDRGDGKDITIYICGLCTDICVVSNALILRAKFPNHRIVCVQDCCAGTSREAHEAALRVMESCQINVISYFTLI